MNKFKLLKKCFCDKIKNIEVDKNKINNFKNELSNQPVSSNNINDKDKKIENFYTFMEENIKNYEIKDNLTNINNNNKINLSNAVKLTDFIKCPMTDGDLEMTDEGLKIGHITYPKRNGIYILLEEEAKFNF